jgi:phosphomevalonate kinase
MKEMGDLSGVPIEPKEQTALLNTCMALPGVIGGGVPGGESLDPAPCRWKQISDLYDSRGLRCDLAARVRPN